MPLRQDSEHVMQKNMARMARGLAALTNLVQNQAATAAAQTEANAQRIAAEAALNAQRAATEEARVLQQQQRDLAADQTRGLNDFRRHDPPKFMGGSDPEKADLWLQEVEKIFGVLRTPVESKVGFASYLLLGEAEYWWQGANALLGANN